MSIYLREKFLIKEHILCCDQFQFPWREIPVFPGKVIEGGGLKKIQRWNICGAEERKATSS